MRCRLLETKLSRTNRLEGSTPGFPLGIPLMDSWIVDRTADWTRDSVMDAIITYDFGRQGSKVTV